MKNEVVACGLMMVDDKNEIVLRTEMKFRRSKDDDDTQCSPVSKSLIDYVPASFIPLLFAFLGQRTNQLLSLFTL